MQEKLENNFYFFFPECNCNVEGSEGDACDEEGRYTCRCNVKGDKCDECNSEYYGFPTCYGMF